MLASLYVDVYISVIEVTLILTCHTCLFLVKYQEMSIRRLALESIYKLCIQLQTGEYTEVCMFMYVYTCKYAWVLICTLYFSHLFSGGGSSNANYYIYMHEKKGVLLYIWELSS